MDMGSPRVFVSYSHDSPPHKAEVLELAKRLRADGYDVFLDQDQLWVEEGWTVWMMNQLAAADYVLVVCTETYKRRAEGKEEPPHGAGASWEGAIIRLDLYEANGRNKKFIPVLIRHEDEAFRPVFLRDYSYFVATDLDGYRNLCAVLNQGRPVSPVGTGLATWNIPAPNPYFSGREEYLTKLHDLLTTSTRPTALTQAIKGLGGMGKTQTALKYADLHRKEYAAGFWVVADSRENLISGFAGLARILALKERDDPDIAIAAMAAKRCFESRSDLNGKWLLILDSVEDWAVVQEWIPSGNNGNVVITTRLQFTGTAASPLELPKMSVEEGSKFLLDRGKIEVPDDADVLAAKAIAEEFGGLPLGLEQAGAYIEEAMLSLGEYLELYREEGKKLRARGSSSTDHDTISVTFTLAFEKLGNTARQIVRQASFLAPDAIPEDLLTDGQKPDIEFRDAIADAVRFSLIQRSPTTKTIDIHRLVREVVKDAMTPEVAAALIQRNCDSICRAFPENVEFANWPTCERLLPHARAVISGILECSVDSIAAGQLLHQTGWYLLDRDQHSDAEPIIRKALEIRESALGPSHPETAKSVNNLGRVYMERGQYQNAEPLYGRALNINETALGPDHPDTATSLNNLAQLYRRQGRHQEAEPFLRRALEIRERVQGPDHPQTGRSLNNLAQLYVSQGRHQEAEPLLLRGLKIYEKALGLNHPTTATSLDNLAGLYASLGRPIEAEPLYRRSLEIREKVVGSDHPDTAIGLNNLATFCDDQERPGEAEPLYRRALEIRDRVLGPDHPDTAGCLNNLAAHYSRHGRPKEAEPLFRRALKIRDNVLGPHHPETLSTVTSMGFFYANRGRCIEADPLLRRALAGAETNFGTEDARTVQIARAYAPVLQKMGRGFDANKLRKRFGIRP